MATRSPRLAFVCDPLSKEYLETWATEENRTVSNLLETLVQEAIAARKSRNSDKEALELALAVIKSLVEGKPPTLAQIVKLAHEANLKEEDLLKLRDYVREKSVNGV